MTDADESRRKRAEKRWAEMTSEEVRRVEARWKSDMDLKVDRMDARVRTIERLVWVSVGGVAVLTGVIWLVGREIFKLLLR